MAFTFNEQSGELMVKNTQTPPRPSQETKKRKWSISSLREKFLSIPVKEKIFLVQQLGVMLQTGISLAVALKTLAEQTSSKKLKLILTDLQNIVERGNLFSDGLEKYKKIFGELFINMIRAGESSGKLEEVLKQLFIQMKKDHDTVSKVRGAMIYPSIVVSAMLIIGVLMMLFVIPNLITIFNELEADLPLATKILIALSNFTTAYGAIILLVIIALVILFIRVIHLPKGRYVFHIVLLKTPIMGTIIRKINLARFCRTLSSLLKTDIAIVSSLEITSKVLGNELYRKALTEAKEKVKKGTTIRDSLEPYRTIFPPVILQMVSVGEETGALDTILEQSAIFFEDEVDQTMKNLPTIIEPVLILLLGVAVAGMAVAIIMPLYSLSEQI